MSTKLAGLFQWLDRARDWLSVLTLLSGLILGFVVFEADLLSSGPVCSGEPMQPGDTCVSYPSGAETTYEQAAAMHRLLFPVGIGLLVLFGIAVVITGLARWYVPRALEEWNRNAPELRSTPPAQIAHLHQSVVDCVARFGRSAPRSRDARREYATALARSSPEEAARLVSELDAEPRPRARTTAGTFAVAWVVDQGLDQLLFGIADGGRITVGVQLRDQHGREVVVVKKPVDGSGWLMYTGADGERREVRGKVLIVRGDRVSDGSVLGPAEPE